MGKLSGFIAGSIRCESLTLRVFNDQRLAGENPESALCLMASQGGPYGCRALIVASVGKSSGNAVETQSNSQLWTGRNPVGWSGITSGNQPRAGDVTGNTSTAWALDDSGTAGIWACGGWIGRDESQQSTDARETGSHAPDNLAKGESSPMRH